MAKTSNPKAVTIVATNQGPIVFSTLMITYKSYSQVTDFSRAIHGPRKA